MNELMQAMWSPGIFDAIILSTLLLCGQILKRKIPFFNTFLLPSAIIAGFLGLALGPEALGFLPLNSDRLGMYVYHLLALGFIALSLKDRPMSASSVVVKTSFFIVTMYLLQGILGLGLSILAAYTFLPQTFPGIGLLLPMGFGQGPGQAFSIGRTWELAGIADAGSIGLTIATLGFLWATFGGVTMANILKKKYPPVAFVSNQNLKPDSPELEELKNGLFGEPESPEEERGELTLSNMIDLGTRQLFLIGLIYLATYGTLRGLSALLLPLGNVGENLANVLWGFHFVFGTMYAILVKLGMNKLKSLGLMRHQYNNNRNLSRISGTSFDFMVTAAIAAISITVILSSWQIILLISLTGGLLTWWFSIFVAKRVFQVDILEYSLVFFGTYTGTLSTGMALLRTVDPTFRTKVADTMVLASGLSLFLAFPLLLILNLPVVAFVEDQPVIYFYALAALVGYSLFTGFFLFRKAAKVK